MALDKIGGGPQQNKLGQQTFGDGAGLAGIARGIGSVVQLGQTMQNIKDRDQRNTEARDLKTSEINGKAEAAILMRDLAQDPESVSPEQFQANALAAFNKIEGSDHAVRFQEKYGRPAPYLEELRAQFLDMADVRNREVEAAQGLRQLEASFGVLGDNVGDIIDTDLGPTDYSEQAVGRLEEAMELADTLNSPAQKQYADGQIRSMVISLAENAPNSKIAKSIMSKAGNLNANEKSDVINRVNAYEKNRDITEEAEMTSRLNQVSADLLSGGTDPVAREALVSSLPKSAQLRWRKQFAMDEIAGKSQAVMENAFFDNNIAILDEKYDLKTGSVWEGDGALISAQERLSVVRDIKTKRTEMLKALDYTSDGGFLAVAEMTDRHPQVVKAQNEINATIEAGQDPAPYFENLRRTIHTLHKNAGVPESRIIPIAAYQVDALLGVMNNPSASIPDQVDALHGFMQQAGPYAVTALNNLARYPKAGVSEDLLGTMVAASFTAQNGDVEPEEFLNNFLEAQSSTFVNAHSGENAKYKGLSKAVNTELYDGNGASGLQNLMVGMAQENTFSSATSTAFNQSLQNYVLWETLQQSQHHNPTPKQIRKAVQSVNDLMGEVVTSVDMGGGRVVNLETQPVRRSYGKDGIDRYQRDFQDALNYLEDADSVDENILTENFTTGFSTTDNNGLLTLSPVPVGQTLAVMGATWEAFKDSKLVNAFFPGAGGLDSVFPDKQTPTGNFTTDTLGNVELEVSTEQAAKATDGLSPIRWGKMDFMELDDSIANDPLFEDVNDKNRAVLNKIYFKENGYWKRSSDEENMIPMIKNPRGTGADIELKGYFVPIRDLNKAAVTQEVNRQKFSAKGRAFGNAEEIDQNAARVEGL